jgi:hypothetical protein
MSSKAEKINEHPLYSDQGIRDRVIVTSTSKTEEKANDIGKEQLVLKEPLSGKVKHLSVTHLSIGNPSNVIADTPRPDYPPRSQAPELRPPTVETTRQLARK